MVGKAGMRYVRIPMTTRIPPTASQQAQFLSLVNDPAHQPVYVHCKEGRHRTGVMTAIYRMTRDGWTADQAFKEMKQFNFGWDLLHMEFKRFVYAFAAPVEGGSPPVLEALATN
jgi:protein tyrosine/serine phosphatase